MIEVRHLTKRYGNHLAISDLNFTIENGRIYGFLGPNGAGKSTTMNIMTGCLGATDGVVLVDGRDIAEEPMAAKRSIGYLPEMPPLYADMTPWEYLQFVGEAKKVRNRSKEVEQVMEKTGVTPVRARLIRNLSKGFRQRVGLAQALLGNPEVIILDEPTVGLDPKQIIEIRDLIRELGRTHTIVLSSHILSEVQAVCDEIMIISNGRLVASDTPENLTRLFAGRESLRIEAKGRRPEVECILSGIDGIENVTLSGVDTTIADIDVTDGCDIRESVFLAFATANIPLLEMQSCHASLEDVFLELTQDDAPSAEVPEQVSSDVAATEAIGSADEKEIREKNDEEVKGDEGDI